MRVQRRILMGKCVQAARRLAGGQVVPAVDAKNVCNARAAIAVSAAGGNLVGALRAIVVIAFYVGSAGGARCRNGLAQQEVEHRSDAARYDDAEHPQAGAHAATRSVVGDVADHEDVESGEGSPGQVEVEAQGKRHATRMMTMRGKNDPEVVLGKAKGQEGSGDRPAREETQLIGEACFVLKAALGRVAHL